MSRAKNAQKTKKLKPSETPELERMALPGWNFAVVGPGWQKFNLAFAQDALAYAKAHGGTEIFSFHSGEYLMKNGELTDYGRYILEGTPAPERLFKPARLRQPVPPSGRPKSRATIGLDLSALRTRLPGRPELLESLEAGTLKATGRPGANVAVLWQMTMAAMYASADVPVLGTRETTQNAVDSIRAAVASRQLKKDTGRFDVIWNADQRTLTWRDNGIGMSAEDILNRFLVLGASGKNAALDSDEAAGGFGVAKAVILGTASHFAWKLHTRDNLAISKGPDTDIQIFQADQYLSGAEIVVYDVSPDYEYWWDAGGGGRLPLEARLKELLAANDLPGITLTFNGKTVEPRFSRRAGSRIDVVGSWGEGTTATVKAYKRSDPNGGFWVRLNGLFMFKHAASGDLRVDVVCDLATSQRPGSRHYPLNASRDSLQGVARQTFRAVQAEVEKENLSAGEKEEDEVYDPEPVEDNGLTTEAQSLARAALKDPALANALMEARILAPESVDGGESIYPSAGAAAVLASDGTALGAAGTGEVGDSSHSHGSHSAILKTNLPDDHVLDLKGSRGRLPWLPKGFQTARELRAAFEQGKVNGDYALDQATLAAIEAVERGALTVAQLRTIAESLNQAALQVAAAQGAPGPRVKVGERTSRKATGNPFGSLAALRISQSYPKERARALKRNPKKWLPYLVLWDLSLKLMLETAGIMRQVKPGFVLEDGTIGMAQRRPDSPLNVIYIHPDRLAEEVERNRERPFAIAGFIHGTAAHELAHIDGRMGEAHSQAFVSAREDLGRRTAHLLPQLATLATKLLKLPEPKDTTQARLSKVERQLQEALESRELLKAEKAKVVKRLEKELATCRAELQGVAESASAQARAACAAGCACHRPVEGVPAAVNVATTPSDSLGATGVSPRAVRLREAVATALRTSPPAGVDPAYVARFLGRYSRHLTAIIDQRLAALPAESRERLTLGGPRAGLAASRARPGRVGRKVETVNLPLKSLKNG